MPSTQVDEYGKVLAMSPGFLGNESDTDLALYHLIVRNEALRRQTDVQGLIELARHLIQSEHLIFRLYCLPLFPHREHLAERLDQLCSAPRTPAFRMEWSRPQATHAPR